MKIGEKEYGFAYTVGAKCDIDEGLIAGGCNDFKKYMTKYGDTALTLLLAEAMSKAYADIHGTESLTKAEMKKLDMETFAEIDSEVFATLTQGQKRTVEAKPSKKATSTK